MNSMFEGSSTLRSIELSHYNISNLTNLERTFYQCQNLTSINLSRLYTTLVINMSEIFYGCNSLIYMDISNFDMINCISYNDMFSDISNIKYINLYNFDNDKSIENSFSNADNLYICQKKKIIKNPRAYICCNFVFEYDECEIIPIPPLQHKDFLISNSDFSIQVESSISYENKQFSTNIFTSYSIEKTEKNEETKIKTNSFTNIIENTSTKVESSELFVNKPTTFNVYSTEHNFQNSSTIYTTVATTSPLT